MLIISINFGVNIGALLNNDYILEKYIESLFIQAPNLTHILMLIISINFGVNIGALLNNDYILEKYKGWGRRGKLGFPTINILSIFI